MRGAIPLLAAALLAGGCALIVGIEDHTLATGTTTTASGGSGGTGTGGGANTCGPPDPATLSCTAGLADCDGDGSCETSLTTDPQNCGSCGHDCLGGACASGVCQQVALSNQYPSSEAFGPLTVSNGRAYYATGPHDANLIYSTTVASMGSPKLVSATIPLGEVYEIVVDEGAGIVLATAFESGSWGLYGMLATGGTPALIQALDDYTNGLAIHPDGTLYIAELHRIVSIDAFDGSLHELVTVPGDVIRGLAIDGQFLYWASYPDGGSGALGKISRATLAGNDTTVLASGLGHPEKIALDEGSVFWTDSTLGTISTVPKQGGQPQTLITDQAVPKHIAVTAGDLYWSADDGLFHARRCALGTPTQLTNDSVGAIAVDPQRVVATDTHFHQVLGFAR